MNSGPCDFYQPAQPLRNALYHNNRDGTFTDVTQKAGVPGDAYGMGVAVGDYDGDGFPDLYVTQYPHSILYHNNGDGTFTDVTAKAGVAAPGWATSAVWFDYDNDGTARSIRVPLCRLQQSQVEVLRRSLERRTFLLHSQYLRSHAVLALPQQRRRNLHRRQQRVRYFAVSRQGVGSGRGGREQ